MKRAYMNQVTLLLNVLPEVAKETCFALHGGTAINLFVRNMPRLSVDIDLTYLIIEDRKTLINNIVTALKTLDKNAITDSALVFIRRFRLASVVNIRLDRKNGKPLCNS